MGFWDMVAAGLGFTEKVEQKRTPVCVIPPKKEKEAIVGDKITIQKPVTLCDVVRLVKLLRHNEPMIINFVDLDSSEAERSLDFICGAVCALGGNFEQIGGGIYFYAPRGLSVKR